MLGVVSRVQFLRTLLLVVTLGVVGFLLLRRSPASVVVALLVLWRSRRWLIPAIRAARALRAPMRTRTEGPLSVDVPQGWRDAQGADGQTLQLDGPGASVALLTRHAQGDVDLEALIEDRLKQMLPDFTIRSRHTGTTTLAGRPASLLEVAATKALDVAAVQVRASQSPGGKLLLAIARRDPAVPDKLLEKILSSVKLGDD